MLFKQCQNTSGCGTAFEDLFFNWDCLHANAEETQGMELQEKEAQKE